MQDTIVTKPDYPYIDRLSQEYLKGVLRLMVRENALVVQFGTTMKEEAQERHPNLQVNDIAYGGISQLFYETVHNSVEAISEHPLRSWESHHHHLHRQALRRGFTDKYPLVWP